MGLQILIGPIELKCGCRTSDLQRSGRAEMQKRNQICTGPVKRKSRIRTKSSWAWLSGGSEAELQIFTCQVERKCEAELQIFTGQVERKCESRTSDFHRPERVEVRSGTSDIHGPGRAYVAMCCPDIILDKSRFESKC